MIELRNLHLDYATPAGPVSALQDVDLHVPAGQVYGVIGRSGAGKSSLIRTINLLTRPTQGTVRVDGQDLTALAPEALRTARHGIGMVFQHFNLLSSRTVFENVALPLQLLHERPALIKARVDELLDLVGLSAQRNRYPAQISGGQKQRVGIARALASNPKVLLSDEATSALDPETTRSILALLRRINRDFGLTIVLITHQMQVIKQVADRVAVLDHGRIVEEGAVIDVFTQPQHATTRSLIEEILPQELPASVIARIRTLTVGTSAAHGHQLLRLAFAGSGSDQPFLSDVVRRFGLDLNIVHGQVDEIQGQPFGSLTVHLHGAREGLASAVAHLRSAGIHVQALGLSPGSLTAFTTAPLPGAYTPSGQPDGELTHV